MTKYQLIRGFLKLATVRLPVYERGRAPIQVPDNFLLFRSIPPKDLLLGLVKAYQRVFSEPPWGETWPAEAVLAKLRRELTRNGFLVLMLGNQKWPVAGFSWGAVIPVDGLEIHIGTVLGKRPAGLETALRLRGVKRIVYFHEFAVLKQFRGGLDPVRFLLRPGLELGLAQGVRQTLFWSTPGSKIVPLSLYMGYEPIFRLEVKRKEIIFLFNHNFLPLLKIAQNLEGRPVARFMRVSSRILGKRKRARK